MLNAQHIQRATGLEVDFIWKDKYSIGTTIGIFYLEIKKIKFFD